MARRSYVKGKSTKDLLNMGYDAFNALTPSELRQTVSRLADAGNKRLKRLGKTVTPATEQAKRSGGKFSTKGKNEMQLRTEYARIRAFLENPTSTKAGYEKLKKEMKDKGFDPGGLGDDEAMLWRLYNKLSELDPNFRKLPPSDRKRIIQAELEAFPEMTEEEHLQHLLNGMRTAYEGFQRDREDIDLSDFFETT